MKWIFGKSNLRKGFLFRREKKLYFQTIKHKKHTPISQGKTKPQSEIFSSQLNKDSEMGANLHYFPMDTRKSDLTKNQQNNKLKTS